MQKELISLLQIHSQICGFNFENYYYGQSDIEIFDHLFPLMFIEKACH